MRTPELCFRAVQQDGNALSYTPEPMKTSELCFQAVNQYGCALAWVPDVVMTTKLCLEAVKQNGHALRGVPQAMKTSEVCVLQPLIRMGLRYNMCHMRSKHQSGASKPLIKMDLFSSMSRKP